MPTDTILDLNSLLIIKLINEEFYSYLEMTDGSFTYINQYMPILLTYIGKQPLHIFFIFKQSLHNLFNFTQKTCKWEKITLLLSKFQYF